MKTKKRVLVWVLLGLILFSAAAGGFWYWYDNNVDRSGWVEKDGTRFYRDFHADPVTGWLVLEDGTYYFEEGGIPYVGWLEEGDRICHFGEDGVLTTGWLEENGARYFFDENGDMVTGWQDLDGNRYYFAENGTMVDGWLWLEEGRYYLQEGILLTGWQIVEDAQRYFHEDGTLALEFTQIDGHTYYFGEDGILATGVTEIDGLTYDFQDDGIMFTGWQEAEEGKRYFHEDGVMAVGWTQIDGEEHYFDENGIRQEAGWKTDGEYRYYILADGSYATGPTEIDGVTHYFTPKGIEVILVNALNPLPENFQQEIVNVQDYHDVDSRCYDALVEMLDALDATGIDWEFKSAYRTLKEQTMILEARTIEHMRDYGLSFVDARKKALETVAIPGTSEHQLGFSVDLVGKQANEWLGEHCWEYGFILRYPSGKQHITGITNEPWHFRYVGKEVSMDMKDSGLCLEEYLGAEAVTDDAVARYHGDNWYQTHYTTLSMSQIAYVIGEEAAAEFTSDVPDPEE